MDNEITEIHESAIEVSTVNEDGVDYKRLGYKELPKDFLPRISMLTRGLSEEIAQKAAAKSAEKVLDGAYNVVIRDGMHLGKSANNKDAFRGMLFSNDGNALKGQADLLKIDGKSILVSPQIISGVFNAMSFATGQYYMSEINKNLKSISTGIDEIQDFLKTDKACAIKADYITLSRICRDMNFIMENDYERKAVSSDLKRINNNAIANIEFFKIMTESAINRLYKDSKVEEFQKVVKKLEEYYPQYWCSVFNYILSEALNAILSEMDSSKYLTGRYIDLNNEIMNYRVSFGKSVNKLEEYIQHSKKLNKKNMIPKELVEFAKALPTAGFVQVAGVKAAVVLAAEADAKLTKESKAKKKKAISREEKFIDACNDCVPLNTMVRMIEEYRIARNSEIEMVVTKDKAYIRYKELEDSPDRSDEK